MEMRMRLLVLAISVTATLQRSFRDVEKEFDDRERISRNWTHLEEVPDCNCHWQLLRHYEAKGCTPLKLNSCGCPVAYDCSNANEIGGEKVCHYKGKEYQPGSVINTTNLCELCHCSKNPEVQITCIAIQCSIAIRPLEPNCHYIYGTDPCCPQSIQCVANSDKQETDQGVTCEYNNQLYPLGAKIYSKEDPCETCICTSDWVGMGNSSFCYREDCVLEKYKASFLDGCVPVYDKSVCCPDDFYCAPNDASAAPNQTSDSNLEHEADTRCIMAGKVHDLGQSLFISHKMGCIKCTCQTPPDFTCVQEPCAPNPNEEFCNPFYTTENCCPQYDCIFRDDQESRNSTVCPTPICEHERCRIETSERGCPTCVCDQNQGTPIMRDAEDETEDFTSPYDSCDDIECRSGKVCMLYEGACENASCPLVPICTDIAKDCPIPQCSSGCSLTIQSNGCPSCACDGQTIQKRESPLRCKTPHCAGIKCQLIQDSAGCYECHCKQNCNTVCRAGCNVVTLEQGKCPQCVCEDETTGCPTPICEHNGCRIETSVHGCPTCKCDPVPDTREVENTWTQQKMDDDFPRQRQPTNVETELESGSREDSYGGNYDYEPLVAMRGGQQQRRNVRIQQPAVLDKFPSQESIQSEYEKTSRGAAGYLPRLNVRRRTNRESEDP